MSALWEVRLTERPAVELAAWNTASGLYPEERTSLFKLSGCLCFGREMLNLTVPLYTEVS
jgi:hypothetical protein